MTKPSPETRSVTMNLRTTPTIKRMAEALSAAEERSIANTIERLIRDAYAHRIPQKKKPAGS